MCVCVCGGGGGAGVAFWRWRLENGPVGTRQAREGGVVRHVLVTHMR